MNAADYLLELTEAEQTAIITDSGQITYRDVREASARVVGELIVAGIRPGDRVGLLARNTPFWVAAYLGILKLVAIAVPFATAATAEDLAAQNGLVGCRAVCAEQLQAGRLKGVIANGIPCVLDAVLRQPGPTAWPSESRVAREDADAALMSTSSTTARPRAVRVTHRNIQANTDSIIKYLELTSAERMLVVLPFYYCFGTSMLHTHLRVGGTIVLSNTFSYPETTLATMEAHRCTGFAGVPSTLQTLLRNSSFPKRQWPALRKVQPAGGELATVLIHELQAALPQAQIYVMYGQAEATARLSYLPPNLLQSKLGSVGHGIPGGELRVVNESGASVQPDEVGEILARGENVCPGYWDDSETTAERFADGTLQTGDLATVDEDGYLYVVDRKSDFVKCSQQVEACLQELPDVVNAAVVGVPDIARGEAIIAFVTTHAGTQLESEQIIAHCSRRLARHMVPPKSVHPRSPADELSGQDHKIRIAPTRVAR